MRILVWQWGKRRTGVVGLEEGRTEGIIETGRPGKRLWRRGLFQKGLL